MLRALGSDFLRGTAGGTLMVIAGFLAIPPALTWLLWLAHGLPSATALRSPDAPMRYYFSFAGMMWLALTALGAMYNARVMRRNMGLPLSTGLLAVWHLGSICTLVFCGNLTAQLCYKYAWQVTWPILGDLAMRLRQDGNGIDLAFDSHGARKYPPEFLLSFAWLYINALLRECRQVDPSLPRLSRYL